MNADPMLLAVVLAGALVAGGLVVVVGGMRRPVVALDVALDRLAGRRVDPAASGRGGSWVDAVLRLPLSARVRSQLQLNGSDAREFAVDKLVYAGLGLVAPGIVSGGASYLLGWSPLIPAGVGLLGAAVGFFVPDLRAVRAQPLSRHDAAEALFAYFDLVTLERLANQSAIQSLTSAAALSDAPLFVQIRAVLERARLEQRAPYGDLGALADELTLPELRDLVDVMRLDETGAALSGALRARVKELRDAQLTQERIAAQSVSERMTVWMTVPSLVFALIFLTPPLLRLLF